MRLDIVVRAPLAARRSPRRSPATAAATVAMRSKDRLAEFLQLAGTTTEWREAVYRDTVELALKPPERDKEIETMFEEVDRMRGWIHELNNNTQLMRRLHTDPTFHNNKNLQDQFDSVVTQCSALGLKLCGALRQFEARVSSLQRAVAGGGVLGRIARLQYAVTRQLFSDALAHHQRQLQLVRDDQLALLHEQINLTNLTISDEECQNLLDSKNISLFVDNLQAETAEARRVLRDVEARHEELTRVEAALRDVRDLFQQLAHLVVQQQEQLDSVEYYALQATEHVEVGGQQLLKGTVSRAKAKKKKLSLIICLVSGFLIVLLVLIYT